MVAVIPGFPDDVTQTEAVRGHGGGSGSGGSGSHGRVPVPLSACRAVAVPASPSGECSTSCSARRCERAAPAAALTSLRFRLQVDRLRPARPQAAGHPLHRLQSAPEEGVRGPRAAPGVAVLRGSGEQHRGPRCPTRLLLTRGCAHRELRTGAVCARFVPMQSPSRPVLGCGLRSLRGSFQPLQFNDSPFVVSFIPEQMADGG